MKRSSISLHLLLVALTSQLFLACPDPAVTPPAVTNGSFTINEGLAYTNSRTVTLHINVPNATQMRFRNEDSEFPETWETYATTKEWTLSEADGAKEVFAEFDNGQDSPLAISASIEVDTVPPTFIQNFLAFAIDNNAVYTTTTSVTLKNSATGARLVYNLFCKLG